MTLPVAELIVQQLLEYDPTYDVGGGVATTGLMIDPLSVILQPIINELTAVQSNQSILTILEQSDPDAYPEDIVDGLASNVYVERLQGEIATTTQRVRFFEAQDFSSAQGILVFRSSTGKRYLNASAVSITEAEMSLNIDGSLVYVDIPITALDAGTDFNVAAGDITQMEAEPSGVANTANLYDVEDGRSRETNTELIDRIKVAVTVRALVTGRGIIVTLTENFTTIVEIQPVGFGDAEMMRDIVYNVHIGGNVDVYVKTATLSEDYTDSVLGLPVDATRRVSTMTTIAAVDPGPVSYSILKYPVDRTDVDPVVATIDGFSIFTETADYTISDTTGAFTRVAGGSIPSISGSGVDFSITDSKTLEDVGAGASFATARRGMVLTISAPASVAGTYTVKEYISDDELTIFGTFPGVVWPVASVSWALDENLTVSFEYNPIAIDIIETVRSSARTGYTIVDVPVMDIDTVAVLEPISGEPTGELLNGLGGYGAGTYGTGGYGVGSEADYRLVVAEPTLRFSQQEDNFIEFTLDYLGYSVRVSYLHASAIEAIQDFVDDEQNRTEAADLLVRHFNPAYVETVEPITYQIAASSESTGTTLAEMKALLMTFINGIDSGDDLEASDIVDLLYDNGAVQVDLDPLLAMRAVLHHHNGETEHLLMSDAGIVAMPAASTTDPTDRPISPRIARFIVRDMDLSRTIAS